jgi:beta-phosphoglucomutase
MTKTPYAFIFDLNGTMINDMEYHADAWSHVLNNVLHANLPRSEVKKQMYGKNEELIYRVFGKGHLSNEKIAEVSMQKELRYQEAYRPHLRLIDGLHDFLQVAKNHGIPMAIGSAAITFNIDFVLDNLQIRHFFDAIVSADDVETSKPDPETFIKAAQQLSVDPQHCIVFEDAPKGVEAAQNAKMKSFVLTTLHEPAEFLLHEGIIGFAPDYNGLDPMQLIRTLPD